MLHRESWCVSQVFCKETCGDFCQYVKNYVVNQLICGFGSSAMGSRAKSAPRAFQAPVDVHSSTIGHVYLFAGGLDDFSEESSEEELNVVKLRPRGAASAKREHERVGDVLLLERSISHGDTLNTLALQYGCKIADIKRVNNLIREQDLYALKSIKIPVKKHSLLTESGSKQSSAQPGAQLPLPHGSSAAGPGRSHLQEYTDFLRQIDCDIERLIQSTENQGEVLTDAQDRPQQRSVDKSSAGSGADWGIQWWNAVLVMLLIGIILPLFYVVYYKTQEREAHVNESIMNTTVISTSNVSMANQVLSSHE
ncbi:lysM and putative peptidoglycan-binding domain-containing protein 4-like [Arapaima gigas]